MNLDEIDPTFVDDLDRSGRGVQLSALWTRSRGGEVRVPPTKVRPSSEQWSEYSDDGDWFLRTKDGERRCESKFRTFNFSGPHDFGTGAGGWPTAIVDAIRKFDGYPEKPMVYHNWSADEKCVGVIDVAKTFQYWVKSNRLVRQARKIPNYECPIKWVRFVTFPADHWK